MKILARPVARRIPARPAAKTKRDEFAVARIRLSTDAKGRTTRKIEGLYQQAATRLSYATEIVRWNKRTYKLRYPLRCSFEHDEDGFTIENEMLGLIGTGNDMETAVRSFSQEFDFIYRRYNGLPPARLTANVHQVKLILNSLVSAVK